VEDEEMDDPAVTGALAAAARRGVKVRITMTADPEWDQAFTEQARAGVHIRPYQNATATAGGYAHSYSTNGSGYALIYLNGPPPDARITVTVGGATCTTSD
jgi:hypothetical protein